jgi:flagellar FliL protein
MEEIENKTEKKTEDQELPEIIEKKGPLVNPKIFLYGLPLFIVQLIAVYFITANVLMSKIHSNEKSDSLKTDNKGMVNNQNNSNNSNSNSNPNTSNNNSKPNVEVGKFLYSIDDIIVNPAETDGKRLLLTSVGFDFQTEDEKKNMQAKEIITKDIIIAALSSKSFDKLTDFAYRDTLKAEITSRLRVAIPQIKLNRVYFSKFIVQ